MFIQTASAIFKHFKKQNENKAADLPKAKNIRTKQNPQLVSKKAYHFLTISVQKEEL